MIKKADKGSAVVIMDRSLYIEEGIRQLSDPKFYHEVNQDLTPEHKQVVNDKLTPYSDAGEIHF